MSSALETPWNFPSDSAIPYQLLIPPAHFKTWRVNEPTTKPPEAPATVAASDDNPNGIWIEDSGTGRDVWYQITLPPHLATNLIPLAREIDNHDNNIITPSSGTLDLNLLPPPDINEPFLPKAPANYIVDGIVADGVNFEGSGESINNGFGELLSGTTGQESDKSLYPDGKDGGHDVPFDVTLPHENFWSRGDAPDFEPKPQSRVLVRTPTTTKILTTTFPITTTASEEPFGDYFSDFSSIFPQGTLSLPSEEPTVSVTTILPATTTKESLPSEESQKPTVSVTTKLPATTTKEPVQTTKTPATTEVVLDNKISNINDNTKLTTSKIDISREEKEEELNNLLLNDEGVGIQDLSKPRPVLESSEDIEDEGMIAGINYIIEF